MFIKSCRRAHDPTWRFPPFRRPSVSSLNCEISREKNNENHNHTWKIPGVRNFLLAPVLQIRLFTYVILLIRVSRDVINSIGEQIIRRLYNTNPVRLRELRIFRLNRSNQSRVQPIITIIQNVGGRGNLKSSNIVFELYSITYSKRYIHFFFIIIIYTLRG